MLRKDRFTATEIADTLCRADDLQLEDQSAAHNRLRYLSKRGILQNGEKVDARGTMAYPTAEVFRAAVFCELMAMAMDVRALTAVTAAAEMKGTGPHDAAPSQKVEGGIRDHGGLVNAVLGANEGEEWSLTLAQKMPGHSTPATLHAEFRWDDAPKGASLTDEIFGSKPVRTKVTVSLSSLFRDLIAQVGMPE